MRFERKALFVALCVSLIAVSCTEAEAPTVAELAQRLGPVESPIEEEEALEEEGDPRAAREEGKMGAQGGNDSTTMLPKIVSPKTNNTGDREQVPLKNIFGNMEGFDSKLGPAMGGEGNTLVLGRGSGGLGMRGTGRGGGGSYGQLHGQRNLGAGGAKGAGSIRGRRVKRPPISPAMAAQERISNAEGYTNHGVNPFVDPAKDKLSTFAIDVDTGAYTIARRKLAEGVLPPAAAVRVEEFINFFNYRYSQPDGQIPFGVDFEAAPSPFRKNTLLMRVGVQGRKVSEADRKPAHLVFLVDVSGSMSSRDKLPLVQKSLHMLVNQLKAGDTVALCTYAGAVREVLAPTGMNQRAKIHQAIEDLRSGGSTAMSDGLENAYKMAYKTLKPGHVNRVIVLSDGDANVGRSTHQKILERIKHYTQEGVTLSTVGFGMGNYKDTMMEQLANKGNGNYHYIDSYKQARRVFVEQLGGTLQVIAKDVKIQVEFNPGVVASYRLLGYENRDIKDKDFRNDAVDAGEIGAGHSVTAVYEVKLKKGAAGSPATVRIRHKAPQAGRATENTYAFEARHIRTSFEDASHDFQLATMVAAFAEKLRKSPHAAQWSWSTLSNHLPSKKTARSKDERELLDMVERARKLSERMYVDLK